MTSVLFCYDVAAIFVSQDDESSGTCMDTNEADVDEKLCLMRPVVALETLDLSRYVTSPRNTSSSFGVC